ncbi:NAD(P)-dependent oxidoreductase [Alloyangia pacifica]|uniref:Phosphoglycerate dehydrogenase n=1 Tax=Alloyangia pacifica TaxID=311180 RepID=A0A1I6VHT7_9RHOB|nr:NAD(P)-dependent oxidoreductase [Alloyangia pacifica]SDH98621.1 Phosphoglycerate dehydrogenase [Alloyangia pacifica]SFT13219.1 Phosphoglycerate dehydrogenase [Alloyangia pacifica]
MTLRIVNHLGPEVGAQLAAHPAAPEVITPGADHPAWQLPEGTEALVTAPRFWKGAPTTLDLPGSLRWVQSLSAGIEAYPPELLSGRVVTCGRGLTTQAIAEYVLAAILQHRKPLASRAVRDGNWSKADGAFGLPALAGQTVGLVGFGAISQAVALRARAFGVKIVATRRGPWTSIPEGIDTRQDPAAVAAVADHLVIAAPATPETRGMIGKEVFAAAKPGLHLINVARGAIVDQDALLQALASGQVGAATLDVTDPEPLPDGHPLYADPRVTITPHISWVGGNDHELFSEQLMTNLDRWLSGGQDMLNRVDPERGY